MHDTQLLTQEQAAAFLGVKPNTLAVWRCTNRVSLPYVKLGARLVRYRQNDLEAFLDAQTVGGDTDADRE